MDIQSIFINASITVLSLGIVILSLVSYRKSKNVKLIFVTTAFLLFLMKGILLSLGLFHDIVGNISSNSYFGLIDVIILLLLFVSTLKR